VVSTDVVSREIAAPGTLSAARAAQRTARAGGRRGRIALGAAGVLIAVVLAALMAPWISPSDPAKQDIMIRLTPPFTVESGRLYVLGTDQLGRDVLSRVLHGARVSLAVGAVSAVAAGLLGVTLGLMAGYGGGVVDVTIMRLVELRLAFPLILLALVVVAFLGPTPTNIVLIFTVTSWPIYARTLRTSVLAARGLDYVVAARSVGSSDLRVLVRHILPNVVNPAVVLLSFEMARLVILEASLGFLGLGVQPPTATWGNMLAEGREVLDRGWWVATFPGLAILVTTGAINVLGDALRDRLDPRLVNV
jgi:peptide/nickel transport system permease protein